MQYISNSDASQRSILITGCSSGIGYATAHYLRNEGWRVFASCRKPEDCARLENEGFESPQLDYRDSESIQACVKTVLAATGGRLDALYNNGAYATPAFTEDLPRTALREIFEVNLFGYLELIQAVLPTMRAQGHGRIINCSSVLGFAALRARGAYNSTKFALEGLTDTLRLELANEPIDIVLIEPGPIESKIRENSIAHFERYIDWKNSFQKSRYESLLIPRLYQPKTKKDRFELPADAVAKVISKALNANRPRPRYYITVPTYIMGFARRILSSRGMDWLARKF